MIAIKQRNKRPFQEIEKIRDALNDSIYIFFDNYDMFYDKVWLCCFLQRRSCHAITTFLLSVLQYIFMFNKTIVLFHHFFRLFNLFLYILMQYFVNSYLHMYSYYPQGKKVRKFKKRTAATCGYV